MRLTKAQMQEDIDFLLYRAMDAGSFRFGDDRLRCVGVSSNEIVRLAYTGEHRGEGYMPSDHSDAGACARTWAMLPAHRQTTGVHRKVIEGIEKVRAKYPDRAGHNPEAAAAIAKAESPA